MKKAQKVALNQKFTNPKEKDSKSCIKQKIQKSK